MDHEGRSVYLLPAMENNYIDLLTSSLPEDAAVIRQSTKRPFTIFIDDIVRERPDTVHMHWPHPYFLFFGLLPTKPLSTLASTVAAAFFLMQFAVATTLVDSTVWTLHNRQNHNSLQPNVERLVHIALGHLADTVTVWDEATMEIAEEEFRIDREKLTIVPHNNYLPIYEGIDEDDASATCQSVCDQTERYDRVLLYFGRIREYKDVVGMIEAFETVDAENVCLVVAGNPSESLDPVVKTAINTTEDVIGDLRYVPDEDVPRYFKIADITIFPYNKIFNSGSILLAMSFATPFVAPRLGAIPGVAPDGNIIYGESYETPPRDVVYNELTEGVHRAVSMSDQEVEQVGKANLDQAEASHSKEVVRDKIVEAYSW